MSLDEGVYEGVSMSGRCLCVSLTGELDGEGVLLGVEEAAQGHGQEDGNALARHAVHLHHPPQQHEAAEGKPKVKVTAGRQWGLKACCGGRWKAVSCLTLWLMPASGLEDMKVAGFVYLRFSACMHATPTHHSNTGVAPPHTGVRLADTPAHSLSHARPWTRN